MHVDDVVRLVTSQFDCQDEVKGKNVVRESRHGGVMPIQALIERC